MAAPGAQRGRDTMTDDDSNNHTRSA